MLEDADEILLLRDGSLAERQSRSQTEETRPLIHTR